MNDSYGDIFDACQKGAPIEVVEDFVKRHIEEEGNATPPKDWFMSRTPLHHVACCCGHASIDIVRLLVESYPNIIQEQDLHGMTALHCAIKPLSHNDDQINLDMLEFLINDGSSLSIKQNGVYTTPLHQVCMVYGKYSRPLDVLRLRLLQMFAEKDRSLFEAKTNTGSTPLHIACANKASFEIIKFLIDQYPSAIKMKLSKSGGCWTPLHGACVSNIKGIYDIIKSKIADIDTMRLLITKYPDPLYNMKNTDWQFSDAMNGLAKPQDSSKLLQTIHNLIHNNPSDDDVLLVLNEFINEVEPSTWWGGIKLVLDIRPTIVHKLNLNENLIPNLLAKMGQQRGDDDDYGGGGCTLESLFRVIQGIQGITNVFKRDSS